MAGSELVQIFAGTGISRSRVSLPPSRYIEDLAIGQLVPEILRILFTKLKTKSSVRACLRYHILKLDPVQIKNIGCQGANLVLQILLTKPVSVIGTNVMVDRVKLFGLIGGKSRCQT